MVLPHPHPRRQQKSPTRGQKENSIFLMKQGLNKLDTTPKPPQPRGLVGFHNNYTCLCACLFLLGDCCRKNFHIILKAYTSGPQSQIMILIAMNQFVLNESMFLTLHYGDLALAKSFPVLPSFIQVNFDELFAYQYRFSDIFETQYCFGTLQISQQNSSPYSESLKNTLVTPTQHFPRNLSVKTSYQFPNMKFVNSIFPF